MTTPPDPTNGDPERVEAVPPDGEGIEVSAESLARAITDSADQERYRTDSRLEVALRGVEAAEKAEQIQYELALKQIESEDERHKRRYGLGRLLIVAVGILFLVLLILVGLVIAMAFFGDDKQSETALTMLRYGSAAVGGGGIVLLISYAINSLTRWWQRM